MRLLVIIVVLTAAWSISYKDNVVCVRNSLGAIECGRFALASQPPDELLMFVWSTYINETAAHLDVLSSRECSDMHIQHVAAWRSREWVMFACTDSLYGPDAILMSCDSELGCLAIGAVFTKDLLGLLRRIMWYR